MTEERLIGLLDATSIYELAPIDSSHLWNHIGKTAEQLRSRTTDSNKWGKTIYASTSFLNAEVANDYIIESLKKEAKLLTRWLNSNTANNKQLICCNYKIKIGIGYLLKNYRLDSEEMDLTNCYIVLEKRECRLGFIIRNAYPTI